MVDIDALLCKALNQENTDPFGSPLTSVASSPASSRCSSSEPGFVPPTIKSSSSSSAKPKTEASVKHVKLNNGQASCVKTARRIQKDKKRSKERKKRKMREKPSIASCHDEEELKAYIQQQSPRHFEHP
ncbi:hypothetical protein V5O48_013949, partial [Marasmius crinis-equi]